MIFDFHIQIIVSQGSEKQSDNFTIRESATFVSLLMSE